MRLFEFIECMNPTQLIFLDGVLPYAVPASQLNNSSDLYKDIRYYIVKEDSVFTDASGNIHVSLEEDGIISEKTSKEILESLKSYYDGMPKLEDADHIKDLPDEVIIERGPYNIRYMDNPPEYIQLKAVSMMPDSIRLIKHPTLEVCRKAVSKDPNCIMYVPHIPELVMIALTNARKLKMDYRDICSLIDPEWFKEMEE